MEYHIKCPEVVLKEVDQVITNMITDTHRDDFIEVSKWLIMAGLGQEGAGAKLIEEISTRVSKEITHGIVQITMKCLDGKKEYCANITEKLPEYFIGLDFVMKSGGFDLKSLTYWFKVESEIVLDNYTVVVKNHEIVRIEAGDLIAAITLAYCGHNQENKEPSVLLKNREIVKLDLSKIITFDKEKTPGETENK